MTAYGQSEHMYQKRLSASVKAFCFFDGFHSFFAKLDAKPLQLSNHQYRISRSKVHLSVSFSRATLPSRLQILSALPLGIRCL